MNQLGPGVCKPPLSRQRDESGPAAQRRAAGHLRRAQILRRTRNHQNRPDLEFVRVLLAGRLVRAHRFGREDGDVRLSVQNPARNPDVYDFTLSERSFGGVEEARDLRSRQLHRPRRPQVRP